MVALGLFMHGHDVVGLDWAVARVTPGWRPRADRALHRYWRGVDRGLFQFGAPLPAAGDCRCVQVVGAGGMVYAVMVALVSVGTRLR